MAIGDILEALAQGASSGYETYSRLSQAERERQEREKERQEQRAYQREVLALQRRAADRADAEAERQRVGDIEKGLSEGSLREVQDVLNPAAIRQTASEARSAVARSLDEGLFEGAGKAPAQTYAAQRIAGEAMRPSMSFMEEVPEFTPSETFRERGSQEYGGSAVRPVTPEEAAARKTEKQDAIASLFEAALGGSQSAAAELAASGYAGELQKYIDAVRPEVSAPRLESTAGGFMMYDPERGGYVPALTASGERMMPATGTPPAAPNYQRVADESGNLFAFNPRTLEVKPVINPETGEQMKQMQNSSDLQALLQLIQALAQR